MELAFRDEVPPVPKNNKPNLSLSPKTLMIAGVGVVIVILAFVLISFTSSGGISPQLQRLSARLSILQTMVDESKKSVTDAKLSKLNSDLSILTTGSIARLQAPMKAAGLDKVGDDIKAAEADTATLKTLEEAKLTGIFDRTYARIIKNKIDTILALMNEIHSKTKNTALREALASVYQDFSTIRKQLDEDINV
ncbi:hypothetical protein TM7_0438 [candidate division TM7 genomosp. GTL1]|nr:hypothetical protein TM7_0438 [candidate division TM7 genomosp. GTL1]